MVHTTGNISHCDEVGHTECEPGLILPAWRPIEDVSAGEKAGRAVVYLVVLMYVFLGKSIVCDKFMEAIEHITSKQRVVKMKKITGEEYIVLVKVWNETVASLTLMALGSSAPEILISVIEICGNGFEAGELGPGSIVGSAAFNLLLIVPICVWAVPSAEIRRIKHIDVFWVTAVWSVFAYVWLYFMLSVISRSVVDLWEAVLTLLFFPLLVITSYITDKKYVNDLYRRYFGGRKSDKEIEANSFHMDEYNNPELREFEKQRHEYLQSFKQLREKYPEASIDAVIECAIKERIDKSPKSHAYYRVQAMRKLTGGGDLVNRRLKSGLKSGTSRLENSVTPSRENLSVQSTVTFDKFLYICTEDVGTVVLTILCDRNGLVGTTIQVDYRTQNGTALEGMDFKPAEGTLTFEPNEDRKSISVEIIDDAEYEPDEHFKVVLSNIRGSSKDGGTVDCKIVDPTWATVMIVDDDHCGAFGFEHEQFEFSEGHGTIDLKVIRTRGCKSTVTVPFKTVSGTAIENKDFEAASGHLDFLHGQTESTISIKIINDQEFELSEFFYVELEMPTSEEFLTKHNPKDPRTLHTGNSKPYHRDENDDGRPSLDKIYRCKVILKESKELNGIANKMMANVKLSLKVGASSWKEQFEDAFTVSSSSEEEDAKPGCYDYVMHCLSFPWKLLFACMPPPIYLGGWLSFVVSLGVIGILTAIVIDLAEHFGCTVGLDNMVLAITIIALGTSLPDVYASKIAALHDETADASIVNVNGANGVNVFLGIGIAWTIAAVYHKINGSIFEVDPGSLAFNVTLFCVEAVVALAFMQVRRYNKAVLGELGGPLVWKLITIAIFVSMWVFYIILSSLQVYCIIPGF